MGFARRRGMKSEKYTRVNYIQSPGTSAGYLYLSNSNSSAKTNDIECTFEYLGAFDATPHCIYGTERGTSTFKLSTQTDADNNGICTHYSDPFNAHLSAGKHTVKITGTTYDIDGDTYTFTKKTDYFNTQRYGLFGCRTSYNNKEYANARIWSFKVTNNNVPIIDCVPVVRVSDGACGMLDTVKDVFYTNTALTWG